MRTVRGSSHEESGSFLLFLKKEKHVVIALQWVGLLDVPFIGLLDVLRVGCGGFVVHSSVHCVLSVGYDV